MSRLPFVPSDILRAALEEERVLFHTPEGALRYRDVAHTAARFANALRALGAQPGDRIAVQVDKSCTAACLYFGVLQAGLVFVPFNTAYTARELAPMLEDAEPFLLICDPSRRDTLTPLAPRVLTLDAHGEGSLAELARAASDEWPHDAPSDDAIAAIVFTSGTTGRSKGATLTHGNLRFSADALARAWRMSERDVLLHALPIFHVHGLFIAMNTLLRVGGSMYFLDKFNEDAWFSALPRCTVMMGVPTHYVRLLADARLTREATAHMRLFVSGSAPLLGETFHAFAARTGHTLLERYGMTETSVIASNPYDGARVAGTVGMALPGTELRIGGEGKVGVVQVRGPHVFHGYWRREEQTRREHTDDGFFITGDLGQLDAEGRLTLIGRAKDLIITGGLNVYPKEIELLIDAEPEVVESAVVGIAHPDFGEAVTAFVVFTGSNEGDREAALLAKLTPLLAAFKRPKRVVALHELPRNTMGKVQKNELRAQYTNLYTNE